MVHCRHVRFDIENIITHKIQPYSETVHDHPHQIPATQHGWKSNPSRADLFTGKYHTVMTSRRETIRRALKPKSAHRMRPRIIKDSQSQADELMTSSSRPRAVRAHGGAKADACRPPTIGSPSSPCCVTHTALDASTECDDTNNMEIDAMDLDTKG